MSKRREVRFDIFTGVPISGLPPGRGTFMPLLFSGGKNINYKAAKEKGREKGLRMGLARGQEIGRNEGWQAGYGEGFERGFHSAPIYLSRVDFGGKEISKHNRVFFNNQKDATRFIYANISERPMPSFIATAPYDLATLKKHLFKGKKSGSILNAQYLSIPDERYKYVVSMGLPAKNFNDTPPHMVG